MPIYSGAITASSSHVQWNGIRYLDTLTISIPPGKRTYVGNNIYEYFRPDSDGLLYSAGNDSVKREDIILASIGGANETISITYAGRGVGSANLAAGTMGPIPACPAGLSLAKGWIIKDIFTVRGWDGRKYISSIGVRCLQESDDAEYFEQLAEDDPAVPFTVPLVDERVSVNIPASRFSTLFDTNAKGELVYKNSPTTKVAKDDWIEIVTLTEDGDTSINKIHFSIRGWGYDDGIAQLPHILPQKRESLQAIVKSFSSVDIDGKTKITYANLFIVNDKGMYVGWVPSASVYPNSNLKGYKADGTWDGVTRYQKIMLAAQDFGRYFNMNTQKGYHTYKNKNTERITVGDLVTVSFGSIVRDVGDSVVMLNVRDKFGRDMIYHIESISLERKAIPKATTILAKKASAPAKAPAITTKGDAKKVPVSSQAPPADEPIVIDVDKWAVQIGDSKFIIPPLSIDVSTQSTMERKQALRSNGSVKSQTGHYTTRVELNLYFNGAKQLNDPQDGLRGLIAQFKRAPFLPVESFYLNEVHNIHALTLSNMTVQLVPGFPNDVMVKLITYQFNHTPYMPGVARLADAIDWELFRWYYQRNLIYAHKDGKNTYGTGLLKTIPDEGITSEIGFRYVPLDVLQKFKKKVDKNYKLETQYMLDDGTGYSFDSDTFGVIRQLISKLEKSAECKHAAAMKDWQTYTKISNNIIHDSGWSNRIKYLVNAAITSKVVPANGVKANVPYLDLPSKNPNAVRGHIINLRLHGAKSKTGVVGKNYTEYKLTDLMSPDEDTEWTTLAFLNVDEANYTIKEAHCWKTFKVKDNIRAALKRAETSEDRLGRGKLDTTSEVDLAYDMQDWLITDGDKVLIQNITVAYENMVNDLHISGMGSPTHQFLGSQDVFVKIDMRVCSEDALADIRRLMSYTQSVARDYHHYVKAGFLAVDNDLIQLFGVEYVLIDQLNVRTVENYPGVYDVEMILIDFNLMQKKTERSGAIIGTADTSCRYVEVMAINPDTAGNAAMSEDHNTILVDQKTAASRSAEALRKNIVDSGQETNAGKISRYMTINEMFKYFDIYPDLDLPTWRELKIAGDDSQGRPLYEHVHWYKLADGQFTPANWGGDMKNTPNKGVFVDPDFYFFRDIGMGQYIQKKIRDEEIVTFTDILHNETASLKVKAESKLTMATETFKKLTVNVGKEPIEILDKPTAKEMKVAQEKALPATDINHTMTQAEMRRQSALAHTTDIRTRLTAWPPIRANMFKKAPVWMKCFNSSNASTNEEKAAEYHKYIADSIIEGCKISGAPKDIAIALFLAESNMTQLIEYSFPYDKIQVPKGMPFQTMAPQDSFGIGQIHLGAFLGEAGQKGATDHEGGEFDAFRAVYDHDYNIKFSLKIELAGNRYKKLDNYTTELKRLFKKFDVGAMKRDAMSRDKRNSNDDGKNSESLVDNFKLSAYFGIYTDTTFDEFKWLVASVGYEGFTPEQIITAMYSVKLDTLEGLLNQKAKATDYGLRIIQRFARIGEKLRTSKNADSKPAIAKIMQATQEQKIRYYQALTTRQAKRPVLDPDVIDSGQFFEYVGNGGGLVSPPNPYSNTSISKQFGEPMGDSYYRQGNVDSPEDHWFDYIHYDASNRMLRAFPTYHLVLIDEGRQIRWWKLWDNFYGMSAVMDISVNRSRKSIIDTCSISISNSYGGINGIDSRGGEVKNQSLSSKWMEFWNPFQDATPRHLLMRDQLEPRLMLSPGSRISLRLGYGSNAGALPTVFNGTIAEINTGEVVDIIAQGDGMELTNKLGYGNKSSAGAFGFGAEPRNIILSNMISRSKLKNYMSTIMSSWNNDLAKVMKPWLEETGDTGIVHFGTPEKEVLHYHLEEIGENVYSATGKGTFTERDLNPFTWFAKDGDEPNICIDLNDRTTWDLIQTCTLAIPNYVATVQPVGFRSSLFYGKPSWGIVHDYILPGNNAKPVAGYKGNMGNIVKLRKPLQQWHTYSSNTNIIDNGVVASGVGLYTNVLGSYIASPSNILGSILGKIIPIGGFEKTAAHEDIVLARADRDIYPQFQRTAQIYTGIRCGSGTFGAISDAIPFLGYMKKNKQHATAFCVAQSAVRDYMKDMYQGELIVLGDPSVKPYDAMYIWDAVNQMYGTCEVKEVTHHLSFETGFITSIQPDLCVSVADPDRNKLWGWGSSLAAGALTELLVGSIFTGLSRGALVRVAGAGTKTASWRGTSLGIAKATNKITDKIGTSAIDGVDKIAKFASRMGGSSKAAAVRSKLTPANIEKLAKVQGWSGQGAELAGSAMLNVLSGVGMVAGGMAAAGGVIPFMIGAAVCAVSINAVQGLVQGWLDAQECVVCNFLTYKGRTFEAGILGHKGITLGQKTSMFYGKLSFLNTVLNRVSAIMNRVAFGFPMPAAFGGTKPKDFGNRENEITNAYFGNVIEKDSKVQYENAIAEDEAYESDVAYADGATPIAAGTKPTKKAKVTPEAKIPEPTGAFIKGLVPLRHAKDKPARITYDNGIDGKKRLVYGSMARAVDSFMDRNKYIINFSSMTRNESGASLHNSGLAVDINIVSLPGKNGTRMSDYFLEWGKHRLGRGVTAQEGYNLLKTTSTSAGDKNYGVTDGYEVFVRFKDYVNSAKAHYSMGNESAYALWQDLVKMGGWLQLISPFGFITNDVDEINNLENMLAEGVEDAMKNGGMMTRAKARIQAGNNVKFATALNRVLSLYNLLSGSEHTSHIHVSRKKDE